MFLTKIFKKCVQNTETLYLCTSKILPLEQSQKAKVQFYSESEERINIWSHFIGIILSCIATIALVSKSFDFESSLPLVSFLIYGFSMMTLYTASTLYHKSTDIEKRFRLKILDHASIYLFIAGTYTPYCLISMMGNGGWTVFAIVWSIALIGIIFKIFFTGKFKIFSTLLYVAMGWIIVFSYSSLKAGLNENGRFWLFAGGIAYTIGAILYSIKKINYNHAIFHVFVLLGSIFHFISIYNYINP